MRKFVRLLALAAVAALAMPAANAQLVIEITRGTDRPQNHCFKALKAGSATVQGTFGGKTGTKAVTVP